MEHPNTFPRQLQRIIGEAHKPPLVRLAGILALSLTLLCACSSSKDISTRPLYTIDKFKIEDNIERTIFIEQLILAKVNDPVHPSIVTLDMYVRLGRAVYAMNVHTVDANLPDRDEIILVINGKSTSLTAAGPSRTYQLGGIETESIAFFLDELSFKGLRYCEALEIHYDQHVIPIPREGLGAIWNFLKD